MTGAPLQANCRHDPAPESAARWRRAMPADLPLAMLWFVGSACALLAVPLLPWLARLAAPCFLHALTGIPCLACGSTRAALALARGDLDGALALNPLAATGLLVLVAGGFAAPAWVALGGPVPRVALGPRARVLALAVMASNWAYLVARR